MWICVGGMVEESGVLGHLRLFAFRFFIYLFPPAPFFLDPLPTPEFRWVFVDNDGNVGPKDSCPLMSCFKDMFESSK